MQLFVLITVFFGVALLYRAEAATITHGGDSVDIDFVDIGNASNVADETTGFGALSYDY
ncbi:MAG: hypothetical protein P8P36_09840 [Akkermansiaceae bacterium]|nr:hypothetical protein [Akkermansiaceae bacterium]